MIHPKLIGFSGFLILLPTWDHKKSGRVSAGEFKGQGGIAALLDDFGYDARREIIGFELVYIGRGSDPVLVTNPGASNLNQSRETGIHSYF